jgi:hypothetical protein
MPRQPVSHESPFPRRRNGRIVVGLLVLTMLMAYLAFLLARNIAPAVALGLIAALCTLTVRISTMLFPRPTDDDAGS